MLRSLFPQTDFLRNVLTLLSGTVLAQAIPILLSPILSRIYTPEEFGIFAIFSSFAAAFAAIATFRYELAIMLPEKESSAVNLLRLSFIITVLLTALSFLFILLFSHQLPIWLSTPELSQMQFYLPLFLLFAGGAQALNYWLSRQKKFRLLAAGKVSQTGITGIVSIGLGINGFSSLGLIIGSIAGQFAALSIYFAGALKKLSTLEHFVSRKLMQENFRTYKTFITVNTPHALLGVLQDILVIFLLNYFFSKSLLGSYAFAFRILKVPAALIGAAMFQVYFQKASTLVADGKKLQSLTKSVYVQMSLVGVPIFTALAFFAPTLFSWIFGASWREAGEISQLLSPWLLLNFIFSPVAAITIVLNKQQWAMRFALVDTLLRCAAIIIGGRMGNAQLSFVLLSLGSGSLLLYALYRFYYLPVNVENKTT